MAQFEESFGLNSIVQAAAGAVAGVITFYVLGSKATIPPIAGIIIILFWLGLFQWFFTKLLLKSYFEWKVLQHVVGGYFVTLVVSTIFALLFNAIEWEQVFTFQFWGSTPVAVSILGLITAIIFDYKDSISIMDRLIPSDVQLNPTTKSSISESQASKISAFCKEKFINKEEIQQCVRRLS